MGRATEDTAGIGRALTRALPPAIASGLLWLLGRTTAAFVVAMVAVGVLALGLAAPGVAERLDVVLHRFGEVVARVVAVAFSALTWALVLLPVWALSRAVRYSPLDPGWANPDSNWTTIGADRARRPDGRPTNPTRMGAMDPGRATAARRRGHLRLLFLAPVVVVALILAVPPLLRRYHLTGTESTTLDLRQGAAVSSGVAGTPGAPPATVPPDLPVPKVFNGVKVDGYAHDGEPWASEHIREVTVTRTFLDYFLGFRLGDMRAKYLNVKDGRRVSYTPPGADLTVWFFGGSTMFGIGQRDDHTIPSVVAHLAQHDGIRINAMNFGVSGYVNFQETVLLAEKLTQLPKPDLVVFYDGVNDFATAAFRFDDGSTDPSVIDRLPLSDAERTAHRSSIGNPTPMPQSPERTDLRINLGAEQYRRGAETARALGRSYGFPVLHVWQPQPFAKPPHPADDELYRRLTFSPDFLPETSRIYAETMRRSGVNPIDLTHVLDDVMAPVFFDSSHTNEMGARIIATALYQRIRPELAKLDAGRP